MACTIAVADREAAETFVGLLAVKVQEDGRFTIGEIESPTMDVLGLHARKCGDAQRLLMCLREIRVTRSKPYPGQHPGECLVERKKPNDPRPRVCGGCALTLRGL